jgi:hypothetical protein
MLYYNLVVYRNFIMKITTDLVSKFVDQDTVDNWSDTCIAKLTLAYDRNELPCLIVHDCAGCKVYSTKGFKYEIKLPNGRSGFNVNDLEESHGLEIYKHLNCEDYLPVEVIRQLILKDNKDYFWVLHQKTQAILCVVRIGRILSFYENKKLIENVCATDELTIQEFLDTKDLDLICPG